MNRKPVNPYNVQGISFETPGFLARAKRRAQALGISLSKYVCLLVKTDLGTGGDLILKVNPTQPYPPLERTGGLEVNEAINSEKSDEAKSPEKAFLAAAGDVSPCATKPNPLKSGKYKIGRAHV